MPPHPSKNMEWFDFAHQPIQPRGLTLRLTKARRFSPRPLSPSRSPSVPARSPAHRYGIARSSILDSAKPPCLPHSCIQCRRLTFQQPVQSIDMVKMHMRQQHATHLPSHIQHLVHITAIHQPALITVTHRKNICLRCEHAVYDLLYLHKPNARFVFHLQHLTRTVPIGNHRNSEGYLFTRRM